MYSHSLTLAWSESVEEERRFRRFMVGFLAVTMILGITIPLLPVVQKTVSQSVEPAPRIVKLIFEKRTPPIVKSKPKPVEKNIVRKTKPVTKKRPAPIPKKVLPKPVPAIDKTELARKKASTSGLLAMQDSLADLRDPSALKKLRNIKRVTLSGSQAKSSGRSLVTSKASAGSKGIDVRKLSRDTGSTVLAGRNTTIVSSPVNFSSSTSRRSGSSLSASRSDEDLQIVFDKNKGAIFSIYNRALRKNPTLRGKLVLRLTIASSGKVSSIELVSSELGTASLEKKLLRRIKLFNFGVKNVGSITVTYPIDFFPV